MNLIVLTLLLVLTLSSCGTAGIRYGGFEHFSDQDFSKAIDLVWCKYLGKCGITPPTFEWKKGNCAGYSNDSLIEYEGECYYGLFFKEQWLIWIIWRGSFSKSAFSHELFHGYLSLKGIYDPDHLDPLWDELDIANKLLRENGL